MRVCSRHLRVDDQRSFAHAPSRKGAHQRVGLNGSRSLPGGWTGEGSRYLPLPDAIAASIAARTPVGWAPETVPAGWLLTLEAAARARCVEASAAFACFA